MTGGEPGATSPLPLGVEHVAAGYDRLDVLHDVTLQVADRQIVALLGANGAGKTTTLRVITGLLQPRRGVIKLFGQAVQGWPAHRIARAGVGHVPSGRELFTSLSVLDNLRLGARIASPQRRADLLQRVLDVFPALRLRLRQRAGSLSGGEQQMVAIGRALMTNPRLLLLDEPSTGLAPKVVMALFEVLARLRQEGLTILLVEQNVRVSLDVADRAYVIDNGRIVLSGSGSELANDRRVVAAYLGFH